MSLLLDHLPHTCGVYIFWGEGKLPLYIGKSVDIRSRVMSHVRAPDEAEMMSQSKRVDYFETAGEIGALLLESHWIKQMNPIYNVRLRRTRNLCTLQLISDAHGWVPQAVVGRDLGLGQVDGLYGLFSSPRSAHNKLRELADQHSLCLGLLGLEKIGARGCFGLQLKTCLGACVGQESRALHDARLLAALQDMQVHAWPFAGAIDLIETQGEWVQRHRIQDWRYLGTQCTKAQALAVQVAQSFDLDTYKILVKPIMLGTVPFEVLAN